jgi:carboxypeptidase PM20D1
MIEGSSQCGSAVAADELGTAPRILAATLRFATIAEPGNDAAFDGLQRCLQASFPRLHALERHCFAPDRGLLYVWPGSDPGLAPWAMLAHQDVVGADQAGAAAWCHPPFAGEIADDFVWGRGALDMKGPLVAGMQAIENLLAAGFAPRRTMMMICGADEETAGSSAAGIAAWLRDRGRRLVLTLDEGGLVMTEGVAGLRRPVALVGTAQKGELVLRLVARTSGGHGAIAPHLKNASARIARAILVLQSTALPVALDGSTRAMLRALAVRARPPWSLLYRLAAADRRLAGLMMPARRPIGAVGRSTIVVTRMNAGHSDNVVPDLATATVDLRLCPGHDAGWARGLVERLMAPLMVEVEVVSREEASSVSAVDGPGFRAIAGALARVLPSAACIPYLTPNSTDSRFFAPLAEEQYRFTPILAGPGDLARFHGVDERISVAGCELMVAFYEAVIRGIDAADLSEGTA